jgi:DNA repair protein RadC
MLMELPHEECHVMLLRNNLTLKGTFLVGRGGITESAVDIRLILEAALRNQSTAIVLCHNHPSGSLTPSTMDKNLTRQLAEACRIMNIRLLDHVIVSDQGYFSFKDQGLMD